MVWKSNLSAHKLSNIFMIIGFTIAFLSLLLGISVYENYVEQDKEIDSYNYMNQSVLQVMGIGQMKDSLDELLQQSEVNVDLFDYTVYLNDMKVTRMCEVRLKQAESSIYPLMEGEWFERNISEKSVPTVVVGRAYEPYFIKKDGENYLTINYCDYKVTGVLAGESKTLDFAVILDYETMPETEKDNLLKNTYCGLRIGSNIVPVNTVTDCFRQKFSEMEIYYEASLTTNSVAYNTSESDTVVFYVLIYIFALGICIICSELWVYERKTEIIICKTFGWSKDLIIEKYYKEFLQVLSVAVMFSVISQWLISAIGKRYVVSSGYCLCIIFCVIIISSIIAFIIPMMKIHLYMPDELLKKESELV